MSDDKSIDFLKCRYCDWKCRKYTTSKSGKPKNGWSKLEFHIETEHRLEVNLNPTHDGLPESSARTAVEAIAKGAVPACRLEY